MPTIILTVDLACCKCNQKIQKTLCELQDRWDIQTITYDEKKGTVTISGPFDPNKLAKKLCCKACKVIKNIEIVKPKPADPPPPPPPEKKPDPPPPPPPEKKPDPPPPPPPEKKPEPPKEPEPAPPKLEPVPPEPEPVAKAPEPVEQPVGTHGPVCCCWYHGMCRCCSCGRAHGCPPVGPPVVVPPPVVIPPPVVYCGPYYDGYKNCELVCEEDRSCRIM